MDNNNELTRQATQIQMDIDNILISCLNAPKFNLDNLKDNSEFLEPNPRLIYEAEQKRIEEERIENERQSKLAYEAEQKKIEEERIKKIELAERARQSKISSFWDSISIVFFIIIFIFAMILISVISSK
jgi:hypothetical protein